MKQDTGSRDRITVRDAGVIKRLLRRRGLTYRDTAARIGVSPATVSRIANQDGRPISERAAIKLAKLVGMDFEDLFGDEVFFVARNYARKNRVA